MGNSGLQLQPTHHWDVPAMKYHGEGTMGLGLMGTHGAWGYVEEGNHDATHQLLITLLTDSGYHGAPMAGCFHVLLGHVGG